MGLGKLKEAQDMVDRLSVEAIDKKKMLGKKEAEAN